ncbi:MAG: helix-turn-helix domain-containing protein [Candidatus Omnitrophica bacterium]|nr:helix-turn-helix domain-containing protein [Candidatus Omnitrophota bacterium]
MSEEKLLTVREVSILLNVSEKEVMDLAQAGVIPAYKVGGVFLRFKKDQIHDYQKSAHPSLTKTSLHKPTSLQDKISDFFYFYDFYILSGLLILLLLAVIFQG